MEKLFAGDGEVKVESGVMDLETRLSVIQALIPLGLEAVADVLQQEVEQLAGVRELGILGLAKVRQGHSEEAEAVPGASSRRL